MENGQNAMNQPKTERFAYSLQEVSTATGLSVSFLRIELRRGRLRASRAGRRVLVSASELRRYLEPEAPRDDR